MRRLRIMAMIILIPFWAGLAGCGGGEGGEVKSNIKVNHSRTGVNRS